MLASTTLRRGHRRVLGLPGKGGVGQVGTNIRIYANLLDVASMNIVKAHKWTTTVADLFGLSDEIADEVGRAVEVELIIGAPAGLYPDLGDPQAIEQVYLGWYHLTEWTPEAWPRAVELFGKVAASHPDKPYGHVLSAFANWLGANFGWAREPEATLQRAYDQAQIGLAMGDPTGMAQTVEAAVLMSRGRGEEALQMIENLEISRPTCDAKYGLEASVRRYLGQWEKAVDLTDTAMRLTGVNKSWYPTVKACSLFTGGKAEQAATVAEMVLDTTSRRSSYWPAPRWRWGWTDVPGRRPSSFGSASPPSTPRRGLTRSPTGTRRWSPAGRPPSRARARSAPDRALCRLTSLRIGW